MALELGGATAFSFLKSVFGKLASTETIEYFKTKIDEDMLSKLKHALLSINAVVDDAEHQQIGSVHVRKWLHGVQDAVFDAEDVLEIIEIYNSQRKLEAESHSSASSTSKVLTFFDASFSSFDRKIRELVQEILQKLSSLLTQKDILQFKHPKAVERSITKLPSTCSPLDHFLYGRDDEKSMIFDWLKSDTKDKLSVFSLVGMGGIGKTALAQHVYNDPKIMEIFDLTAWVYVSEEFDACRITRAALAVITGTIFHGADLSYLQVKLKESLTGKKFFLVLDDIWNENPWKWDVLSSFLSYGAPGSKILITTRSMQTAIVMNSKKAHQLEQLGGEHCWKLFVEHAFTDAFKDQIGSDIYTNFEEIGKEVIQKCQGLPLALKAIGGHLSMQTSLVKWERISRSEIWNIPGESDIIPALMLSYQELPSHLKKCFAYCALFPKGYIFEKDHLILLWMAEFFLKCPQEDRSESMQNIGEQCFNDLLLRSFFQPSMKYDMRFVMHDLLHDLAKYVSGDFSFTLKVEDTQNISEMTRYFSFLFDELKSSKGFERLFLAKRLRTFLPLSMNSCQRLWSLHLPSEFFSNLSKLKFLRVLSLYGCLDLVELPDTIANAKHLRHLNLSRTGIKRLPDSLCSLYNLQILKLKDCAHLEELPENLHKLINLCYLDFTGTNVRKMPMEMGKLKNLEVLSSFYVDKGDESNIKQLGGLNLHGKLSILELQNIVNPIDVSSVNIEGKIDLVELELTWNGNSDNSQREREVLDNLQPSKHLKKLSVNGYGGTLFPDWFGGNLLSNMVSLKLSKCGNCILIPSIGTLRSLKHLEIIGLSGIVVIGKEFYMEMNSSSISNPFPSLETLIFKDMNGWEEWDCQADICAFPRLRKLSVVRCPNLKGILPKMPASLTSLEILYCKHFMVYDAKSSAIPYLRILN